MWSCNIHNSVHDWRRNKLFHEQNEGNLFLFFSLYLLLSYSSSSCISCRIHGKAPYYTMAFTSPGPPCISSSSLPSPKCLQSILHLPLVLPCSLPLLGWPVKYNARYPTAFQPSLDWAKRWGCSAAFSSEGHQQWLSQAQTWRNLIYLCQSVKFA